jgi:ADP-ribose pyrophosphatase YjhB (NUDIX family)
MEAADSADTDIYASSVYIFCKDHHANLMLLVCLRGVPGRNFGRIFTQGGGIDYRESPQEAAAREAFEEAGVVVEPMELQPIFQSNGVAHYYVVLKKPPKVIGPKPSCRWEVITTNEIAKIFGVEMILDDKNLCTGLAWVPAMSVYEYIKDERYIVADVIRYLYRMGVIDGSRYLQSKSSDSIHSGNVPEDRSSEDRFSIQQVSSAMQSAHTIGIAPQRGHYLTSEMDIESS